MDIQEESLPPSSLLDTLDEDYQHAVLHLAWDLHTETKERTLLFAFVELLPAEIPPPIDDYDPKSGERLAGGKHRVFVRHAVTSARRALDWYLDCRTGIAMLPENDGSIPAAKDAGKKLKLAPLGEEPPWPTLISATDDADILPFVPQWIQCPRTHHLLPLSELDLAALWSAEERKQAQRWLEGRLRFDLKEYPEYWGAVHLVAPNPVYRRLRSRLQPRTPPAESVLLRFQPRAGKPAAGLEVIFREKDPWGVTSFRHVTIRGTLLRMNLAREVNAIMVDVWDARRGFLQVVSRPHTFIRSIHMGVSAAQRTVVQTPSESYEHMRSGEPEISIIGEPRKIDRARSRLLGGHLARENQRTAEIQDQQWFRDQKEEARSLLRSLLNGANSSVLLIDPYFGAAELATFALAVGRYDIPIRILSSAEVLKEPASKKSALEKGEELLSVLHQARAHTPMNPFEIKVMPGNRPAVHDRFLCIDSSIRIIGSSLNEFGSRGTMMLALPDPDAVRDDLMKAWKEAQPLETWVAQRQKDRKKRRGRASRLRPKTSAALRRLHDVHRRNAARSMQNDHARRAQGGDPT